MGISNQVQIKQLQTQLKIQMAVAHIKLVEVVQQQFNVIGQLDAAVVGVFSVFDAIIYHKPSFLATC